MARKAAPKKEAPKKGADKLPPKMGGEPAPWYNKGGAGFAQSRKQAAMGQAKKEKYAPRWWLKVNDEGDLVFVDGEVPFFVWEHNLKIAGKWGNFITCTKDFKPCPVCESGDRSTYVAYLTCIDRRSWTKTDGTVIKDRKSLFPAKGSSIRRLEDLIKKYGNLSGKSFHVKRYSKEDPNCGSDFEAGKKFTLTGENAKPIDYMKILAPPTEAELSNLGYGSHIAGSAEDLGTDKVSDSLDDLI